MKLVAPQKHLGPKSLFICVILIDMFVILAIDMFVPALPDMQRDFGVTAAYLNLTMFVFFVFSAISIVIAGPLSDRFGRKAVLLFGCGLFAAASLGCALSPNVELLVVFRALEAIGFGAIQTIATALIKDAYEGEDLKIAMTCLQSLIIIGPAAAPFLGTLLIQIGGWREIFICLTVLGVVSVLLAALITETHRRPEDDSHGVGRMLASMGRDMGILGKDRSFMSLALLMGVAGVPYFAFIATVSYILMDYFAVGYLEYSIAYAAACLITIVAPYIYVALSKKLSTRAILRACVAMVALSFLLFALFGHKNPIAFIAAFAPYALAEGIVRPMAFVVLLDQPDERVGTASSFSNFSYSILTSVGTVLATLAWPTFIWGITIITAVSAAIMAFFLVWGLRDLS